MLFCAGQGPFEDFADSMRGLVSVSTSNSDDDSVGLISDYDTESSSSDYGSGAYDSTIISSHHGQRSTSSGRDRSDDDDMTLACTVGLPAVGKPQAAARRIPPSRTSYCESSKAPEEKLKSNTPEMPPLPPNPTRSCSRSIFGPRRGAETQGSRKGVSRKRTTLALPWSQIGKGGSRKRTTVAFSWSQSTTPEVVTPPSSER